MIIKLRVILTGSVCFLFAWPVLGQSPPPSLQVSVSPRDGSILVTETTNSVFVKVSNFNAFTNITVTGSFVAQQNIFFLDDGQPPERGRCDGRQSRHASIPVKGRSRRRRRAAPYGRRASRPDARRQALRRR